MSKLVRRPPRFEEEQCDFCGELCIVEFEWQPRQVTLFDEVVPHRLCHRCVGSVHRHWQHLRDQLTFHIGSGTVDSPDEFYQDRDVPPDV